MQHQIHVGGTRKSFLCGAATIAALLSGCSGGSDSGAGASQALAYESAGFVYLAGVAAPTLEPSVEPNGATSYSIAPALPPGLQLDPATGAIAGEPSAAAPPTAYLVTATTPGGAVSTTLELEVRTRFETPRFAYSLDWDGNRVRTWRVDAETGQLESAGSAPTDVFPFRAVADPLGRYLYVNHFGTGTLGVYAIDAASGNLGIVQLIPVGTAAFELAMSPNGRFLVAGDIGADVVIGFRIDPDTGYVTPSPGAVTLADPSGLAIDQSGERLFAASLTENRIVSYALDRQTGAILGQLDTESTPGPIGLALTPDGTTLYTANSDLDAITSFAIDPASGSIGRLTSVFSGQEPVAMSIAEDGSRLAVANLGGRRIESFAIAPDQTLSLLDTVDLDGSAVALVELGVGGALYAPLFEEALLASALPGSATDNFVRGPVHPTAGRASDLTVVFGPRGASLEPRFAYLANLGAGDVAPLAWDPVAQRLDPLGQTLPTAGKPSDLALSPDGEQLYVAEQLDQAVLAVDRDAVTGKLQSTVQVAPAGTLTRGVAIAPGTADVLAIGNDGVTRFAPQADGSLVALASAAAGLAPDDLAIAPDARHLFVANRNSGDLSVFSLAGDGLTEVAGSPFSDGGNASPRAVAVAPDGTLLAVASADDDRVRIFAVDAATGALTARQDVTPGGAPRELAWSLDGRTLYATLERDNSIAMLDRSDDDQLNLRGTIVVGSGPLGLHLDASGELLFVAVFEADAVEVLAVANDGGLSRLDSMPAGSGAGPAALTSRAVWTELD